MKESGLPGDNVRTPREQTAAMKVEDLGPEVANLTQGLATQLKTRLDENEVIMRNLSSVKSTIGSTKVTNFNQRKRFRKLTSQIGS